jgi:hypothetical protein
LWWKSDAHPDTHGDAHANTDGHTNTDANSFRSAERAQQSKRNGGFIDADQSVLDRQFER